MTAFLKVLTSLEIWISLHLNVVGVIAIPLMTLGVTMLVNWSAERRAGKQRKVERKLAQELKLVDFRQAWITDLRIAFTEYHRLLHNSEDGELDGPGIVEVVSKILFLLNPNDEDYAELVKVHEALLVEAQDPEASISYLDSIDLGQNILKREWERLKLDLENVDRLQ